MYTCSYDHMAILHRTIYLTLSTNCVSNKIDSRVSNCRNYFILRKISTMLYTVISLIVGDNLPPSFIIRQQSSVTYRIKVKAVMLLIFLINN